MDPFQINSMIFIHLIFENYISELQISEWILNPQEGGRLDAKRHYVILAKALDGIWPLGHVSLGIKSSTMKFFNIKFMKITEFCLKWVHMARHELILRLDGVLWLMIISKTPLTPRKAMEGPTILKESRKIA